MFVEGGWRPQPEPPPRRPPLTPRQERWLAWLLVANVVLWLVAPIGGATIIHALLALFWRS